jgi:hypothetical protein
MRPKAQLALKELALRKPSGVGDFLSELKKNKSVSGYHYLPAKQPQWVDLPESLDAAFAVHCRTWNRKALFSSGGSISLS